MATPMIDHVPGISPVFDSPATATMTQVLADLKIQPSDFQGALLRKYAGENLSPAEKAAWALATNNRPMPEEPLEWSLCVGRQGGKSSVIAPAIVCWTILNAALFS